MQFIIDPIINLFKGIMNNDMEKTLNRIEKINVKLSKEEMELREKPLIKAVFRKWLNASEALLHMIVSKLPSPVEA